MIRRISMTVFALAIALPLAAQAPDGWQMRLDRSTSASDPDDVPDVTVTSAADGFQVATGPAVVGFPGGLSRPHQIDVDQEGNLYIASWDGGWMDKYVPKPGADPGKLVGRKLVLAN